MKLQHMDPKRKFGEYCQAKCRLCYAASLMTLSDQGADARSILTMRPNEFVDEAAQSSLVQRYLALSEFSIAAPASTAPG